MAARGSVVNCLGEGRVLLHALCGEEVGRVIDHCRAGADDRLAFSIGIKGESDARRELPGRVLREGSWYSLIPIKEGAVRRIGIDGADITGHKIAHPEDGAAIEVVNGNVLRIPANAGIQHKPAGGVIGVLNIKAGNRLTQRVLLGFALAEGGH